MINALNKKAHFLKQAIQYAKNKLSAQETRWLLEDITRCPYQALLTQHDISLTKDHYQLFCKAVDQITSGEPFDYVLGYSIFRDKKFDVSPAVLIPRPETETLIDTAKDRIASLRSPNILEMGTGSGIIAISLACEIPDAQITATDICHDTLAIAQQNAKNHDVNIHFCHSRWFDQIQGYYDLIISNPPYIAENDPHLDNLYSEPVIALTSGPSGLDAISEIITCAKHHLKEGGWLWFEHGFDQAEKSTQLLQDAGYQHIESVIDNFGNPRVSGAQLITNKK